MRKFLAVALAWALLAVPVYAESVSAPAISLPVSVANGGTALTSTVNFRGTRATSTQSLTSSTVTKIQFNTIGIDTGSCWDAINFYCKPLVAGTYEVCGSVYIGGSNLSSVTLDVTKNGTSGSGGTEIAEATNSVFAAGVSNWGVTAPCTLVAMNGSTDTVEADVTAIGTSPVVNAVRSSTQMTVRLVSP